MHLLRASALPAVLALVLLCPAPAALAQDTDPPVIEVTESGAPLADGSLFNRAVTPVIQVTDASPVTVDVTLDGAPYTSGTAVTGEGSHTLAVSATDDADNASGLTLSFEIDTVPPAFVSLAPADGTLTAGAQVTLSGEVAGAVSVTVDGQPATLAGGGFSAGPFNLAEGERTFSLLAADAAGNSAVRAHRVVRDSTPPAVALSQPAAGAVLKSTPVDVVGSVTDPHLASVTVNGTTATVTGGTFLAANVPLAEGATLLTAEATDAAGNEAEATRTVSLDTQPPSVTITDPAPGTVTPLATLPVSGTASDPHLARVEVNGVEATLDGTAWSADVPLTEGAVDLTVTATDQLGWSATATVSVIRDSTAPEVRITAPADGSYHSDGTVDVAGTVGDEPQITVTVNGTAATVTAGTWSLAAVPLVEGENRLIARVTDQLGNQGAHTRVVYRDTVAPEVLAAEPADGALAVPPAASFAVTFSEELAPVAAGAWRLELADGTPLAATATLDGDVLTVQPDAALPSLAELRLVLTAALTDHAANPLANPVTLVYSVADVEAPPAPALATAPPAWLCASAVALSGTSEPGAVVSAAGGAAGAEVRAADDGTFALSVVLRPESLNRVELTARDRDGNRSAVTAVEVVHDCTGPTVVSAALTDGVFTVGFSEPVDAAGLGAADGVSVQDASGPLAGTLAADAGGLGATFTPDAPPTAGPYRLDAGPGVRDLAGNPLAFPYSRVLGADVAPSFLAGRVLDAATGRPLSGAQVTVLSTDGVAHPEPLPAMTTGADGRFRIPVPAGSHDVEVRGEGYTPVFRLATTQSGVGTDLFDPRLTPAAAAVTVGAGGGVFGDPSQRAAGPALELPAGALAAATAVAVTTLDEQALPALLPYGWSPRGAVWVDLDGAALGTPADLSFPVDAPDGTALVVVSLTRVTLQWSVVAEVTVFDGAVSATLPAGASDGAWAALEADLGPPAPPAPVVGAALGSATAPLGDEVTAAGVSFDPAQVLPSQASLATVIYTLGADAASGLPVSVTVREELTLLDGTVRREAPYDTDLTVYRAADGTPRSRFRLRPSEQASALPIELGAEDVGVHRYAGDTLQGNVLGPVGGSVSDPEGDRVDVPAGALPEPTAVLLERLAEGDLPLAVPAGFTFLGHLELDLSGRTLAVPAALSLELGAAGSGDGLLFEIVDPGTGPVYRPVAALAPTASGWTTAVIDPQDLPWSGVRTAGRYLFARRDAATDLAYLRGSVYAVGGGVQGGAWITGAVDGTGLGWIQISNQEGAEAGRYVLPAPLGAAAVAAEDLRTGDLALGAATLATADQRVDLNLLLQLTGPEVVETVPADGATGVTPGVEPTVRFSEDVDPATLTSGVLLYDGPDLVPVTVEQTGTLVRVVPQATLRPATVYELRVTTAVRDLRGNRLDAAVSVTFTTLESTDSDNLDPTRIHLYAPDGLGAARVQGRSGAVPGGATVFVENTTSFVATPTVVANADGSFELTIQARLSDTLLLHVLESGGNEVVFELTPFLTADGRGAHVGRGATTFTTLDDLTLRVEEGTFLTPTVVRADPQPAVSPAPVPQDFTVLAAFKLDFGGAEAQKALHVTLPTPAGYSGATGQDLLLTRVWRIFGSDYWMLHDLLRVDAAAGVATTELAPEELAAHRLLGPREVARVASLSGFGSALAAPQEPGGGPGVVTAPASLADRKQYLPGAVEPGTYTILESASLLDFVAFPLPLGQDAYFQQTALDGMAMVVDARMRELLAYDAVLLPTRRGETYSVVGRELTTGFRFYDATFASPPAGELQILPPDSFGDSEAPVPISGSPLRFFVLSSHVSQQRALDVGVSAQFTLGVPNTPDGLSVEGGAGAMGGDLQVRLLGLDDAVDETVRSGADGAFQVSSEVTPGHRYLLALGAVVSVQDALEIAFSEGLDPGFPGISVLDAQDRESEPEVEPVGSTQVVRIVPQPGWRGGETYRLWLAPELADAGGIEWQETLELEFRVEGSRETDTFALPAVRDVERLGSWLFVAADTDGFLVLDASDPADLRNAVAGDVRFPFPLADPVTALAVDPHGRVLVAGGGVNGFGQLKIFDPLAFDPAAVAADPGNLDVRYAAFRGSTVVSDSPTTGTTLPEGRPRHVAVISDDDRDHWRIGIDAPPAGVTLTPDTPPATGEWTVTLTGAGGTAGHPVTLRDLTLGRWTRADAAPDTTWSLTLTVRSGDRVELLRNRQTLAYLATLGVGIQVVDVDAFYGEAAEDWDTPSTTSDVIGTYTGFGDSSLRLCNEVVSDIGSSLVDLGTLFSDPAHPMTLVGLVAFRGLGLFESDPADVGAISFYGETCARIGGSTAHVFGLDVVEDYPFDLDGDGIYRPDEYRDYIVVTHRTQGVLIFDATDRDFVTFVGLVPMAAQAERVSVDRQRRRLYVSAAGGGIYVIDFDSVPSQDEVDADENLVDDRILEIILLAGNTNAETYLFPELGLAYAGGLDRGLTGLSVGRPSLAAVVDATDEGVELPRYRQVHHLAPLGVPTAPDTAVPGAPDRPAAFRIQALLPGAVGSQVRLDLVSLAAADGLPIAGAGDPAALPGLPPPALTGADGLILTRLSDNPWEDGYQLFLSEEVVAVADLRAANEFQRTAREDDQCRRCDRAELGIAEESREILSGATLAVRLPAALRTALAGVYDEHRLDGAEMALPSVRWEISPSPRQEPARNPAHGTGGAVPGTLLHSGEFTHASGDLSVRGRGLDFDFTRTYRNQTVGAGPLGPGWDHGYNQRLRELPNGDVELYDGRGRRELFTRRADGGYDAPPGRYLELNQGLARTSAGWVLLTARGGRLRFDRFGRLVALSDATKDSAEGGNEITLQHDLAGRLVEISDDLDRRYRLDYDAAGRLETVTDFSGRTVTYGYDAAGRLTSVTSPAVTSGDTVFPDGLTTGYTYETPAGDLAAQLTTRDDLTTVTDPRGTTWLTLGWSDADGDGRSEEVASQQWGAGTTTLAYDFAAGLTTVTDRRDHATEVRFRPSGQVTSVTDPLAFVTSFDYDGEGNLTRQTTPLGTVTELTYDTGGGRRSRGNVTQARVNPATGLGTGGSAAALTTHFEHDPRTNLPTRITDPRGAVTEVERNFAGLPELVRRAAGSAGQAETAVEWNEWGQPTVLVDPSGRRVELTYHDSGPSNGYLRQRVVDPGGVGLTTRYEVDERGNVIAETDPRGVRHEYVYNEVDWLVEERTATTGSVDGAPPLTYVTRYRHDALGNVVERQEPLGSGTATTLRRTTYGPLGEVLSVAAQRADGTWATETYEYDAELNLTRVTNPEGEATDHVYDPRNLPIRTELGRPGFDPPPAVLRSYDGEGKLSAVTDPRGNTVQTAYDGYRRPWTTIDPLGNVAEVLYDDAGNPLEVTQRNAAGCLLSLQQTVYDLLDRPTEEHAYLWQYPPAGEPCDALPAQARALTTRFQYDPAGRLVQRTDPLGRTSQVTYDGAGRPRQLTDPAGNVLTHAYDLGGNVRREETAELAPDASTVTVVTEHDHDALGRRIRTRNGAGDETAWLYDARGNLVGEVDPEGNLTEHVYDALDRRISTTRPEGLRVELEYDAASRPVLYRDALGNETTWSYDDLGRPTNVAFADGTSRTFSYDPAGNLTRIVDPRGTVIDQTYDALDRLTGRAVTPSAGVEGPTDASFTYDALSRLTRAVDGSVTTDLTYDSLSRLLTDTTAGRTVRYAYDDLGNEIGLEYPSGYRIGRRLDALDRPESIGTVTQLPLDGAAPQIAQRVAGFAYRGPVLLAEKVLGPEGAPVVTARRSYDPARRLLSSLVETPALDTVFAETLTWTPRSLKATQTRNDLNDLLRHFTYDGADRLLAATYPDGSGTATVPDAWSFTYDAAQNLLTRTESHAYGTDTTSLPLDTSGRNRPASVGGVPLEYDLAGNLTRKGDRTFHYDWANRLVRVADPGGTVATYAYDAFNRRVSRAVGTTKHETVWAGWHSLEEYTDGTLSGRRTFGLGLDEIVLSEWDSDGDGTLDATYRPLYDSVGNVAMVLDETGSIIERYSYSPFGERWVIVNDLTPPAVEQVRVSGGALVVELSEEISEARWAAAVAAGEVTLEETATATPVPFTWHLPVQGGPVARKRLVLTPNTAPAAGTELRLLLVAGALEDLFDNETTAGFTETFPWNEGVVTDSAPPELVRVALDGGRLEVTFTETIGATTTASHLLVDGAAATWTSSTDGYTLVSESLSSGSHLLRLEVTLPDLAGLTLAESFETTFEVGGSAQQAIVYVAPEPYASRTSTVGNLFGFHGRPVDPDSGLAYFRNRYLDPELGRFIQMDPMGYVDGPNLYQYGLNNPLNWSDPLGLYCRECAIDKKKKRNQLRRLREAAENRETMQGAFALLAQLEGDGNVTNHDRKAALYSYLRSRPHVSKRDAYVVIAALTGPGEGVNAVLDELEGIGVWADLVESYLVNYPAMVGGGELAFAGRELLLFVRQAGFKKAMGQFRGFFREAPEVRLGSGSSVPRAVTSFSGLERSVVGEARSILASPEFAQIRAAQAAGRSIEVQIGGTRVLFEPGAPVSGMTMFGESGFVIGRNAFASQAELVRTILHETYRLRTSQVGASGVASQAAVTAETRAAESFAERAFDVFFK